MSLAALSAALALTGCATTQQEAARLQLNSARIRDSEVQTRVAAPGTAVRVTKVALIAGRGRTAFVVRVRNLGDRAVSDLPISVGLRFGRGRWIDVNGRSTLEYSYFESHLPLVAGGGTLTWVYTTGRRLPAHAVPFAIVGSRPSPPAHDGGLPPVIRVSPLTARRRADAGTAADGSAVRGPGRVALALHNTSSIPQYQLPVYAFAERAGRYVAAGTITVPHLGSQDTRILELELVGTPDHARVQVEAPPTIFQ
jgi:hypothetical protein